MIRVISNTLSPCIQRMDDMVGKTYEEYEYVGNNDRYVRIENEYIFYTTDVIKLDNEDEQFRRSLLDTV